MKAFLSFLKYFLAIILIFTGFNKLIPMMSPMDMASEAGQFMAALKDTGYMIPFIALTELACGFLLLTKRATPIALIILAPLSLNIVLFHIFLDLQSIGLGLFVLIANTILLYSNREFYAPIWYSLVNGKDITKVSLKKLNLTHSSNY